MTGLVRALVALLRVLLSPAAAFVLWRREVETRRVCAVRRIREDEYERGFCYGAGQLLLDPENRDRLEAECYGFGGTTTPFDRGMSAGMLAVDELRESGR